MLIEHPAFTVSSKHFTSNKDLSKSSCLTKQNIFYYFKHVTMFWQEKEKVKHNYNTVCYQETINNYICILYLPFYSSFKYSSLVDSYYECKQYLLIDYIFNARRLENFRVVIAGKLERK